jgi:hypothetical protein
MDRRNYRWTDRLDCSERVIANITLSSQVELSEMNARAFGERIIRALSVNGNVRILPPLMG